MGKRAIMEQITLLPNYFKKIGLALAILSGIAFIVFRLSTRGWVSPDKDIILALIINCIIIGLAFIAWSKDKTEDELTVSLRLKTAVLTFGACMCLAILDSVSSWIEKEPLGKFEAQSDILYMLVLYISLYYGQKRRM